MCTEPVTEPQAQAWLAAIARGDEAAMQVFYRHFLGDVLRFLRARMNDSDLASDIANEVMLEVWRTAGRFGGRSKVLSWLLGIARHRMIDQLRTESRHVHDSLDLAEPAADLAPGAFEIMAGLEDGERLRACLRALSPAHRNALALAFFRDLSYAEIAEIERCPEGTVKTRVFHAKQALKRLLAERLAGESAGPGPAGPAGPSQPDRGCGAAAALGEGAGR